MGRLASSDQVQQWAREADTYTPVLRAHDRYGQRVDEVEYHPAWHALMNEAVSAGLTLRRGRVRIPAHTVRAAGFVTWYQSEAGHGCPIYDLRVRSGPQC